MIIYLDESGDLGFDFINRNPSSYFVITMLVTTDSNSHKSIQKSVHRTLNNKLNIKKKKSRFIHELKGSRTSIDIKRYFFNHIIDSNNWFLKTVILNKQKLVNTQLIKQNKKLIYNSLTQHLLETFDFRNCPSVNLIIDRSRDNIGLTSFNNQIRSALELRLGYNNKFYILHDHSEKQKGLQAADMFCYGIHRKYEANDCRWYNDFKHKIAEEIEYAPKKRRSPLCVTP